MNEDLKTYAINTWCPGCGNFAILRAFTSALKSLAEEGIKCNDIAIVSGIGCSSKIVDYIDVNSFYSIHGRTIPVAQGIKLAKPNMKVICFAGDGDCYGEGLEHLVFAAKRNIDISVIVHNNRVYGLTTGQFTPTSPLGYHSRSTPHGSKEKPINPLELMLSSNATFIGRGFSNKLDQLKTIIKQAILHKGFSIIDVLQVCVTFCNLYDYYNERVYPLQEHNSDDYYEALRKIREWDYNKDARIALGVFYTKQMPTYEQRVIKDIGTEPPERDKSINEVLEKMI